MHSVAITPETLFQALSDSTRLRIIRLLVMTDEEICLCELVDALLEPQYNLSRHLKVLRQAGLLTSWKEERWVYHRLTKHPDYLQQLYTLVRSLVAAIGTAGRNGILIKGGVHLENLARVRVIALDKTGTLTLGRPRVSEVVTLNGIDEKQLIGITAALEARSQHPLASAIIHYAADSHIEVLPAEDFQSLTGAGAKGRIDNELVYIGKPGLFTALGVDINPVQAQIRRLQQAGNTVILVGTRQRLLGLIAVTNPLRPNVADAIRELRHAGIEKIIMLTGDNSLAANAIAARAGIAMGAAGTDVALETADVALMADDLSRLPYLIRFSRRNRAVIRQNLMLSVLVIGSLVTGAVAGVFSLPVAVLAHEVSEFVVIASGLRMLRS